MGPSIGGSVAYILFLGGSFATAMVLYFGLRAVKLI